MNKISRGTDALMVLALFATCLLFSCHPTPTTNALTSGHWQQVRKDPPTYFPREVPANHPTTYRDGYWVHSGDQQGTQFFIPFRGTELSPGALIQEAQATMSAAAREELESRDRSWHSWIVSADSLLFLKKAPTPDLSY